MRSFDLTPPNSGAYSMLVSDLMGAPIVHTGEWQAINTSGSKAHETHELEDVTLTFDPIGDDLDTIVPHIDHSWADDHFLERVSGEPLNPAPSHVDWPYAVRGNGQHMDAGVFDHTYPERFWAKYAGTGNAPVPPVFPGNLRKGIRFAYGDLNSVVDLLVRRPLTRQAYLPVWFPEDTGAESGQRVPCTLGYHFMRRGNELSCRYYLRSCDIYRHFSNDVYLAAMLMRWVANEVNQRNAEEVTGYDGFGTQLFVHQSNRPLRSGRLVMHIASLHMFAGDKPHMKRRLKEL